MLEWFTMALDCKMGKRSFPVRVDANNWKSEPSEHSELACELS